MPSKTKMFWSGVQAEAPLLLGVFPFGVIYGVLALQAGIAALPAQAMSAIVFAGSSQFVFTQLWHDAAPGLVIVLTVFIVNLRHALYSASLAPYVRKLPMRWKVLLSYLLTDEAYAATVVNYKRDEGHPFGHWFFFGAGLSLWATWQISSAVGVLIGNQITTTLAQVQPYLEFALPLTFIAMLVPALDDRAAVAATIAAGIVVTLAFGLPYKLGLVLAALVGIAAGVIVERLS
jgi:4-azaleucine resistance transporter AzlC